MAVAAATATKSSTLKCKQNKSPANRNRSRKTKAILEVAQKKLNGKPQTNISALPKSAKSTVEKGKKKTSNGKANENKTFSIKGAIIGLKYRTTTPNRSIHSFGPHPVEAPLQEPISNGNLFFLAFC